MEIPPEVSEFLPEIVAIRQDFHANPELGFQEHRTSSIIAELLTSWGIEVHRGIGGTGIVGVLAGEGGGKGSIGLRADMDALPMHEKVESPFRSRNPGTFHGCGHDGHMAILLAAARFLSVTREFSGRVHLIFQPAEEGLGGARAMLRDGLFDRFPCDEVYGFHNWPDLDLGQVLAIPGPCMAGADFFDIRLKGTGSHAATPQKSRDPVVAAAGLITSLQTIVSRVVDPLETAVLSTTRLSGGNAYNVIPAEVQIGGTVRFFDKQIRSLIEAEMRRIVRGCALTHSIEAHLEIRNVFGVTVNDVGAAHEVAETAAALLGSDNVRRTGNPASVSEDFADMLEVVPGAYFMIGHDKTKPLHHPEYEFDDDVIPIGATILSRLVERRLKSGAHQNG
nr:amidohydrolase [Aminobacter niigataensis]WMD00091.1 amidohydrolase [Aminobacter niigataensis]